MKRSLPFAQSAARFGWIAILFAVLLTAKSVGLLSAAEPTPSTDNISTTQDVPFLYYVSDSGRFAVNLPLAISIHESTRTVTVGDTELDCNQLGLKDYGAVWSVTYCDYPAELLSRLDADDLLDSAGEAGFALYGTGVSGKFVSETDHPYDVRGVQYPGRTFTYALDLHDIGGNGQNFPDMYQARAYLADNRLYWVSAAVLEAETQQINRIDTFLDSFFIETEGE
jgi:hypothetical protein